MDKADIFFICFIMIGVLLVGMGFGMMMSGVVPSDDQSTDDSLKIYPVGDNIDNRYVITGVGTGIDYLVEIKCIAEFSSNPKSSYSPSKEAAA